MVMNESFKPVANSRKQESHQSRVTVYNSRHLDKASLRI